MKPKSPYLVSRLLACATAVVILGFGCIATAQSYKPRTLRIWAAGPGGCGGLPPARPCDVFSADGDVEIGVALANLSEQPVTFRNLRWTGATVFEVRDEDGNLASETEELRKYKQGF